MKCSLTHFTGGCHFKAFLMRSCTSTITCIAWFDARINENDRVIKMGCANFPKDTILYCTSMSVLTAEMIAKQFLILSPLKRFHDCCTCRLFDKKSSGIKNEE